MSILGITLRQYMGQIPPGGDLNWRFSPDILVYGTQASMDTESFNNSDDDYASMSWYFSQIPTSQQANYLYIRAVNRTVGMQTSTLYLFYATDDTLLQPQNWKTDGFITKTYSPSVPNPPPVNTNIFQMSALALNQQLVSYDSEKNTGTLITWTPPTPNMHYYLICWVDNTADGFNKPPFSSLSNFANTTELGAYIQKNANMTFLDTVYQSIFIRQNPNQTNLQAPTGDMTSPDIIITGTNAAPDYTVYESNSSYNSSQLYANTTLSQRNFIYLRAKNTSGANKNARVFLYYTTDDQPAPASWNNGGFTVAGHKCNYIDLVSTSGGEILVAPNPIVWQVPNLPTSSSKLILIAYVDDSQTPSSTGPDLSLFGYVNIAMVKQFVANQVRMAWLELNATAPASVPDMSYEYPLSFTPSPNPYYVGLQLKDISDKGTFSISVPGSNAANTLSKSLVYAPTPDAGIIWPLTFNDSAPFQTSLVINYWKNGGQEGSAPNVSLLNFQKKA